MKTFPFALHISISRAIAYFQVPGTHEQDGPFSALMKVVRFSEIAHSMVDGPLKLIDNTSD